MGGPSCARELEPGRLRPICVVPVGQSRCLHRSPTPPSCLAPSAEPRWRWPRRPSTSAIRIAGLTSNCSSSARRSRAWAPRSRGTSPRRRVASSSGTPSTTAGRDPQTIRPTSRPTSLERRQRRCPAGRARTRPGSHGLAGSAKLTKWTLSRLRKLRDGSVRACRGCSVRSDGSAWPLPIVRVGASC